jgi:predicted TIM-barrel fold metal-dependent hydrolase
MNDDNAGRIDVHHHFCSPHYVATVDRVVGLQTVLREWTPEKSLADMDRAGVRTAILSVTTPGLNFGDDAAGRALARESNEYAVELRRAHPGRFGLFAALPLPDVEGALREIAYALDVLAADGVGLFTSYGMRWLGDPHFDPVLEELDRRAAVVFVHPTVCDACRNLIPDVHEAVIEYGTDTTRAIAGLVFSGAASRYRRIRFIFSHAGGTMPFLIGRFTGLAAIPRIAARLPDGVLFELRRFFYDVAQAANPGALSSLMQLVPPAQVLFGTDFPYAAAAPHVAGVRGFFAADAVRAVEYENAGALVRSAAHRTG